MRSMRRARTARPRTCNASCRISSRARTHRGTRRRRRFRPRSCASRCRSEALDEKNGVRPYLTRSQQPYEVVELVAVEIGDDPVAHAAAREALDVEAVAR